MKPAHWIGISLLLAVSYTPNHLPAQTDLQTTRDVLNRWIETRQIASREKSDWRIEEQIITDTKLLLTRELERLDEVLEDFDSSASTADEERSNLTVQRDELLSAANTIETTVAELETRLKTILRTLPPPLTDTIQPLIRRLPEDSSNTRSSIGERMQNVVGILSQADKFNNSLTRTSESREVTEGKLVEVRTLYWGLAMAYYVDASGEFAGIGTPGDEGWEWIPIDGVGPSIQKLMDVYEGTAEIQFVNVPARIN